MNKIALTALITGILTISIIAIFYLQSNNSKLEEATLQWKIDLEHFAWDITVANGKVFTSNYQATYCFNSTNGKSLWNTSLQRNSILQFYQDNIYAGSMGGIVNKLDKETGEILAQFLAPVTSSYGSKTAPEFYIADNKVFAIRDGIAVYDINTEELFWKTNTMGILTLGNASISASESNYIFIRGNSRLNSNNGSTIWINPGWHDNPPIITQEQVIFWNHHLEYSDYGQNIHCVNATTGESLWNYDVDASIFQPVSYNDLLLFGSVKGFLYALNITDGSLVWKTHVDTQHILLDYDFTSAGGDNPLRASPVYVDSQNQRAYWGFILTQFGFFLDVDDKSQGEISCLDISTGDIIWTKQFQTDSPIANDPLPDLVGLTSLKDTIFFTANNHLWTFNKQIGNITDVKIFDHYILPPVVTDNKVFIATDLFLFAYE
jgi:outer membrane protein assembly factor BamB